MSKDTAMVAAETFLSGLCDVLDAMTGRGFTFTVEPAVAVDAESLGALLPRYPLVLRAKTAGCGAAGLMFGSSDAARLAALVEGKEEAAAASDEQAVLGVMREAADPCIGAGFTAVLEKAGRTAEQPEDLTVEIVSPDAAGRILEFFVSPPKSLRFACAAGAFECGGHVLISGELEQLMPAAARDGAQPQADLTDDEVNQILDGIAAEQGEATGAVTAAAAPDGPKAQPQSNFEMVLDIRLLATARLGRVEMPISDILSLGPGSIIDVGRLVDEPVELLVNNKLIARGDVVVVDEKFGLRITEIVSPKERIESMH